MVRRNWISGLALVFALVFATSCGDDDAEATTSERTTSTSEETRETNGTSGPGVSSSPNGLPSGQPTTTIGGSSTIPGTPGETSSGTDNGTPVSGTTTEPSATGPNTIAQVLRTRASADEAEFTWLLEALQSSGLISDLDDVEGDLTLFAPTDAAFEALAETLEYADVPAMLADPDLNLDTILLYHVLGASLASDEIISAPYSPLAGGLLWLVAGEGLQFNNTDISLTDEFDIEAENGLLHAIDGVLRPLATIGRAIENETFPYEALAGAITEAGLRETLSGAGPFTLFAPQDAAFEGVGFDVNDPEFLLHHLMDGAFASFSFEGQHLPMSSGFSAWLDLDALLLNDAPVLAEGVDLFFANGVVHAIGDYIEPLSVQEVLGYLPTELLKAAAQHAGLTGVIFGASNRTIFAPSDEAFEAFLGVNEVTDLPAGEVAALLGFHLYAPAEPTGEGNLGAEDLGELDGEFLTMSDGRQALVDLSDGATIANAPFNLQLLDIVVLGAEGTDRESTVTLHVLEGVMEEPE